MWSFNIARDTMHQQQWLAIIEELGGHAGEKAAYACNLFASSADGTPPMPGRWTEGPSLDGKSTHSVLQKKLLGEAPDLGPARPKSGAGKQQIG